MTVSAKHRRKIDIDGRTYVWWVAPDDDSPFVPYLMALTVVSADQKLFVRYHLSQPAALRHLTVLGPVFRSVPECGGRWRRFRCPAFGNASTVSPRDVASLIRWSLAGSDPLVEVDYRGLPVGQSGADPC